MRLKINHTTIYTYDTPVPFALQQVRKTPKAGTTQDVLSWSLTVNGGKVHLSFEDEFRNITHLVGMDPGEKRIEILCEGEVETHDTSGVVGKHRGLTPLWLYQGATEFTAPGPKLRKLAQTVRKEGDGNQLSRLHILSAAISEAVRYEIGRTDSTTSAEQALTDGHGVCQDHSHIMIAVARLLGHPARYVSGYLMMNDRVDQDASHAWCEVWVDQLGWVGFDVSNGISPDGRYIRVATGRDFKDASPVRGVRSGNSKEELCVSLQVQQ